MEVIAGDPVFYFESIVLPLLGMGMAAGGLFGLYRLLQRWIDRKHQRELAGGSGAGAQDVEELRARVAALEAGADRVQELEERLDFAERMLARERDRPALGGHG